MNDFKDCYQSAVNDMHMLGMKEIHIDASQCMDERRHGRRMVKRMRQSMTTAFSTACVVFLCGFGTVKAAEYIGNVIKVNEWGFESADAVTMARNEKGDIYARVVMEEVGQSMDNASGSGAVQGDVNGSAARAAAAGDGTAQNGMAQKNVSRDSAAKDSAASEGIVEAAGEENKKMFSEQMQSSSSTDSEAGSADDHASGTADAGDAAAEGVSATSTRTETVEMEEMKVKNYSSLKEFRENEDIIFPQPSIDIGGNEGTADITVCGDWAMARYDVEGKVLWVERTDYAQTQGHASSKVFPGGVCNERTYTTAQGYTYTLVDSVRGSEEDELQIHGAVTVGSYEAYIDFMGYTEEEAKDIIESIDLRLYE